MHNQIFVIDNLQGGLFRLTGKALAPNELPTDFYKNKTIKRYKLIRSYLSKPCKIILEQQISNLIRPSLPETTRKQTNSNKRNKPPRQHKTKGNLIELLYLAMSNNGQTHFKNLVVNAQNSKVCLTILRRCKVKG